MVDIKFVLNQLLMVIEAGTLAGMVFGLMVYLGLRHSFRKMTDPPSPLGSFMAFTAIVLFSCIVIGPLFSFVYLHLFVRLFTVKAIWVYGCLNTVVLGLLMNLYAWHRRLRDLPTIIMMNLGGALILGWGIPLLFLLLSGKH